MSANPSRGSVAAYRKTIKADIGFIDSLKNQSSPSLDSGDQSGGTDPGAEQTQKGSTHDERQRLDRTESAQGELSAIKCGELTDRCDEGGEREAHDAGRRYAAEQSEQQALVEERPPNECVLRGSGNADQG